MSGYQAEGLEKDDVNHAAPENVDWNSFVHLDHDPIATIPVAPRRDVLPSNEGYFENSLNHTLLPVHDDFGLNVEDVPFTTLDFPAMDEWWAELSYGIQLEEHDSPTGASTSMSPMDTAPSKTSISACTDHQSPDPGEEGGDRKRRRLPSAAARRILTDCFNRNRENPYISNEELRKLATQTSLSLRQVKTFFANARARKLPRPPTKNNGVDIPAASDQPGPMERFLSSSPEDEGIPEDAVRIAANNMKRPIKPCRSRQGDAASVCESSTSNSSSASMNSLDSRGSRKGRKRQREPSHNGAKSIFRKPSSPTRQYQCTFCSLDFEHKYDWKRHEESIHFPQKEWVCMPNGPVENHRCVFCDMENVDEEHVNLHKSISCSALPSEQRTFQRKDKLAQHIKQVHGCPPPKMVKEWCRPIERNVLLLCGFCSLPLPNWKTRADHIASHFNDSITMVMWLPELVGGIWPGDDTTRNFVRGRFSASEDPEGHITCETCPARFTTPINATLHRRQAHGIYSATDAEIVWSRPSTARHSQRLINLAQQTSRIQIARVGNAGENPPSASPWSQRVAHPDHNAMFSRTSGAKIPQAKAIVNRMLDEPERRGFSAAPHPVWSEVLNRGGIASPRLPARSPLNSLPSSSPSYEHATAPRTWRPDYQWGNDLSSLTRTTGSAPQKMDSPAQPLDTVRTILTDNRSNVQNTSIPVQGMLHSLEQFDGQEAPWPRPPDRQ